MREGGPLPRRTKLRSSKYLNNLIEQDHRGIKFRTRAMLGFKNFESATITIAGIELLRRIRKDQLTLGSVQLKDQTVPALWNAVLAALGAGTSHGYFRTSSLFALEPYQLRRVRKLPHFSDIGLYWNCQKIATFF